MKLIAFFKGLIIVFKPHIFLGWLRPFLFTLSNTLSLTKWIANQNTSDIFNDFYSRRRDYSKRYLLYQYIVEIFNADKEAIDYFEFGVYSGYSFNWWLKKCTNCKSNFYGFDTFEGLPEDWGSFSRGEMSASIPVIDDKRAKLIKGLFQNTVHEFLSGNDFGNGNRKIIHMDADLFSSTLFVLTSLAPYLKKGDVLIFDEFNVPNHEFLAYKMFCDSYYKKTKLIGAVNNYFQVAIMIE